MIYQGRNESHQVSASCASCSPLPLSSPGMAARRRCGSFHFCFPLTSACHFVQTQQTVVNVNCSSLEIRPLHYTCFKVGLFQHTIKSNHSLGFRHITKQQSIKTEMKASDLLLMAATDRGELWGVCEHKTWFTVMSGPTQYICSRIGDKDGDLGNLHILFSC